MLGPFCSTFEILSKFVLLHCVCNVAYIIIPLWIGRQGNSRLYIAKKIVVDSLLCTVDAL